MAHLAADIRGLMIPATAVKLLLPNATISEVITFSNPKPLEDVPEWIYGLIEWRGWNVPLFSFAQLSGRSAKESTDGAKIAIVKALGGHQKMPYVAVLTQGFPRLITLTDENILLAGDQHELPDGASYGVNVNDEEAFVPDMEAIESRLAEVIGA